MIAVSNSGSTLTIDEVADIIVAKLGELPKGAVTVATDSCLTGALKLSCSNSAAKRAVGRLIRSGNVVREREPQEYMGHDDRPVTFRLVVGA